MAAPLLYQFSFSHFCEKARWALDYRGRPYDYRNLVPGFHARVTTAIAPASHVPILVEDDAVVQGSDAIVDRVDRDVAVPLTPADPAVAGEAARWEQFAAEQIGVPLRLWFYFHRLPDADSAIAFLTQETDERQRDALARVYPKVRAAMSIRMNINADSAATARETLIAALDTLDDTLADRDYLVGTAFSRADLSVAGFEHEG
ncbi:MAG: glutathione S-transferase, partial [Gammaproteobacteria bacterium]|nr:glutathione S-transferase [Gammaproteobacteria bacterium]